MAVSTSRGMIKLFDVSRVQPKQIGSGTKFIQSNSKNQIIRDIRSIKCNANGTRVSILADLVRGPFLYEPDTCIHIWNADKDEFQPYEFGPQRYPVSHFWDGQEPKLLACEAKMRIRKNNNENSNNGGSSRRFSINASTMSGLSDTKNNKESKDVSEDENSTPMIGDLRRKQSLLNKKMTENIVH